MRIIVILSIILLTACVGGQDDTTKEVAMLDAAGDELGTAKLKEDPEGVNIKLDLEGLAPGFHGIHVHEFAKCDPPNFTSAGDHFDPDGNEHGLMNAEGAHLGDLPNIEADIDGKVDVELILPEATLLDGKNSLIREEGTSLIVHEVQDDGVSQPSGDSGERIICGEITADEE